MEVFFYGLFMDPSILLANGIEPLHPRKAQLKDYALKIGQRASLVPSPGDTCYGILTSCDKHALEKLYRAPSVADYVPEEVSVFTKQEASIRAWCYNLPIALISGTNTTYALSLYQLAKQYEFPEAYLQKIASMTKGVQ